jgi:pimeloyl-ACP methyl ester carboxylesterase
MTYVNSGGLRLFYSGRGTGPPVLWHTGGCGDGTMWQTAGYIAALPGYRHLLFDQPGHGRSAAPATIDGHHMSRYVEDVVAVLDAAAKVLAGGTRAALLEMAASESEPPPAWLFDHLSATAPAVLAGAYEAFATAPSFWPAAGRITVPTLFLLGVGDDEEDWWALGRSAAAAMPDAQAVALPRLGHLQAFWKTGMSIPPIERFLARLGADGHDWH